MALLPPLIAYVRVSTSRQGKSGLGLEAQRDNIARFSKQEGYEVIGEYVEVETGKGADALERRPQLSAAINAARRRKASIVVAKLDLCVPKIRFCHIDGEGRQGQVVRRRRRGAQSCDGEGRPCSEIDGSSTHYNRRHIRVGSGAGALRQTRSCGRDIRGGWSR
jgi:hypothetical protein